MNGQNNDVPDSEDLRYEAAMKAMYVFLDKEKEQKKIYPFNNLVHFARTFFLVLGSLLILIAVPCFFIFGNEIDAWRMWTGGNGAFMVYQSIECMLLRKELKKHGL